MIHCKYRFFFLEQKLCNRKTTLMESSSEGSYVMSPFVSLSRQKAVAVHLVEPLRAPNLRFTTQQPRSQNNSDVAGFVVFVTPLW